MNEVHMTESVLDLPLSAVPDADEFVRAAMEWHFNPDTGSRFWLDKAKSLAFDPRSDVKGHDDLTLFPNVVNDLRDVPFEDLIPRGYGDNPSIVGVYESGGTTGAPKRVAILQDWWDQIFEHSHAQLDALGVPRGVNWACMSPSGPHVIGETLLRWAKDRGGQAFFVDLDPRWVKRLMAAGRNEEAGAYMAHLLEQTRFILRTQRVGVLMGTGPMLARLAQHDDLVDLVNEKVEAIVWGGATLDADTHNLLRTEVFPGIKIRGALGSTMIGGGPALERVGTDEMPVFDPPSPAITFAVVDPKTGQRVAYGERGQVVMNHVSRSMLLPNNLERDLAVRHEALPGLVGDAVSEVFPVKVFEEETVVEGVY
jgi:phenylacetate-coenzyme A ligase PaaK-like adenylate-forming protein